MTLKQVSPTERNIIEHQLNSQSLSDSLSELETTEEENLESNRTSPSTCCQVARRISIIFFTFSPCAVDPIVSCYIKKRDFPGLLNYLTWIPKRHKENAINRYLLEEIFKTTPFVRQGTATQYQQVKEKLKWIKNTAIIYLSKKNSSKISSQVATLKMQMQGSEKTRTSPHDRQGGRPYETTALALNSIPPQVITSRALTPRNTEGNDERKTLVFN